MHIRLLMGIKFILNEKEFTVDGIRRVKSKLRNRLESCINEVHKKNYYIREISNKKIDVLLIGASTGGPRALVRILSSIKRKLNIPILLVQHMPKAAIETGNIDYILSQDEIIYKGYKNGF